MPPQVVGIVTVGGRIPSNAGSTYGACKSIRLGNHEVRQRPARRPAADAEPVRIDVTLFDDVISSHDHIFDIVCAIGFVEGECEFEPSTT